MIPQNCVLAIGMAKEWDSRKLVMFQKRYLIETRKMN